MKNCFTAGSPATPVPLPYPPELPEGLRPEPRVLLLIDGDAVSHGLVDDKPLERASDPQMRSCLELAYATATAIDPRPRVRCAVSSQTATHHLDVMAASGGNTWLVRRGLNGADGALIEEMAHLIKAHTATDRPGRRRPGHPADLVILVAQDRGYASVVRQLRLLGVPSWLLVPGLYVAAELYTAACAVTRIGPYLGQNTTGPADRRPPPPARVG